MPLSPPLPPPAPWPRRQPSHPYPHLHPYLHPHLHRSAVFGRRTIRQFGACKRGVFALEFAFVSVALLGLVMGILHIGFTLYAQSVLDFAGASLARSFQTGTIRNVTNIQDNTFRSISICPALNNLLDCNSVSVIAYPVTDFSQMSSGSVYNAGASGKPMVLRLTYKSWIPSWPVLNGLGSGTAAPMLITTTIPYVNEFIN